MIKKTIAIVAIFFASITSEAKLGLGYTEYLGKPFFTVSDFMYFNANDGGKYDIYRYGFGGGQTEIGQETINITARAKNGLTIYGLEGKSGVAFHMGAGVANLEGRANSNRAYNNYYMWQPSLDMGVQAAVDKYVVLTADIKLGGSATNYYRTSGLDADTNGLVGYTATLKLFDLNIFTDFSKFGNEDREMLAVGINKHFSVLSIRDSKDKTLMISFKEGF